MADVEKTILVDVEVDTKEAANNVEDLSKTLQNLTGVLEGLSGKLDTTEKKLEDVDIKTGAFGQSVSDARGKFNELADQFEVAPLLIGGVATAIGGVLVGSLAKFIEQDVKTKKALDDLKDSFDDLLFSLGNAIAGGDDLKTSFTELDGFLKEMTTTVDQNRTEINAFATDIVTGLTYVVEWTGKAALGVLTFVQAIVDSVQLLANRSVRLGISIGEAIFGENDESRNLKLLLDSENTFAETEKYADLIDRLGEGLEKIRSKISGSSNAPVPSAKSRARSKGGGGGGKDQDLLDFTEEESLGTLFQLQDEQGAPGSLIGSQVASEIGGLVSQTNDFTAAVNDLDTAFKTMESSSDAFAKKVSSDFDDLAKEFAKLGFALVDLSAVVAGSLAGQGGAWREWQKQSLQAIGGFASALGQAIFLSAIGSAAVPLFGFSTAGAYTAGLGLIALGAALKGGAAYLGRQDDKSGNKAKTSVVKAPNASSLPQASNNTSVINLYLDGTRVATSMSPYLNEVSSTGRLQLDPRALRRV